ncbi:MAG: type 2 isopentenyl-diphosphate Delta-isomerase [Thermoprotei archaeon]|nr:MAG: type 2 isopentenyl-diphosphate Delta-isomerase [Thermoprotei archaeon]RLF19299.1 MAG: type 2 isopentenyl-diphosphate Delta-isomerase [Thermoprotei archaeon]
MPNNETSQRKIEHLMIALNEDVEGGLTTWFEDIYFIHNAITELSPDDINLETTVFNYHFRYPLIIAGMTGGHEMCATINERLAIIAEKFHIGIGVGSQRAAIENPELEFTYSIVREYAPHAFIIANIGASEVAGKYTLSEIRRIVKMVEANALAIHFNALHELVQPEGRLNFKGILRKIAYLSKNLEIPIIAKEVGCGFSKESAVKLAKHGISAIDVGGAGGTNWAIIEEFRASRVGDKVKLRLSKLFKKWGIPTAISICEVRSVLPTIPLIATGGIRNGLDMAKAIALGADLVGIGLPLLRAAYKGVEEVEFYINMILEELKAVMCLVGASNVKDLRRVPLVFSSRFSEWLRQRGINPDKFRNSRL